MLLYDSPMPAHNPRRVRMFLAEKGVKIPTRTISIADAEQKSDDYLKVNPYGQIPTLVLDDGRVLTETVAICRYIEQLHSEPPLFGVDAFNIAEVDMWTRRVEFRLQRSVGMTWLHTHPFTAASVKPQYKEFGEGQHQLALVQMGEFDRALSDREWLDGQRFTIADIVLLANIDFADFVGIKMPGQLTHLKRWHEQVSARPSASA